MAMTQDRLLAAINAADTILGMLKRIREVANGHHARTLRDLAIQAQNHAMDPTTRDIIERIATTAFAIQDATLQAENTPSEELLDHIRREKIYIELHWKQNIRMQRYQRSRKAIQEEHDYDRGIKPVPAVDPAIQQIAEKSLTERIAEAKRIAREATAKEKDKMRAEGYVFAADLGEAEQFPQPAPEAEPEPLFQRKLSPPTDSLSPTSAGAIPQSEPPQAAPMPSAQTAPNIAPNIKPDIKPDIKPYTDLYNPPAPTPGADLSNPSPRKAQGAPLGQIRVFGRGRYALDTYLPAHFVYLPLRHWAIVLLGHPARKEPPMRQVSPHATQAQIDTFTAAMKRNQDLCQGKVTEAAMWQGQPYISRLQTERGKPTWAVVQATA